MGILKKGAMVYPECLFFVSGINEYVAHLSYIPTKLSLIQYPVGHT